MFRRSAYSAPIAEFLGHDPDWVYAQVAKASEFDVQTTQRDAWLEQIRILRTALAPYAGRGRIYLEFAVPRVGRRIDALAVIDQVLFVLEFKVGESTFTAAAAEQVWDYALDLKNFHSTSHDKAIAPILVATRARAGRDACTTTAGAGTAACTTTAGAGTAACTTTGSRPLVVATTAHNDGLLLPLRAAPADLPEVFRQVLAFCPGPAIDAAVWEQGRYKPTPSIIEAAMALYGGHKVEEISRRDAGAINLAQTSDAISAIISDARDRKHKAICFVTGVPGAGKTLVGLNIATQHMDKASELYSVFLSGNGPLVAILREALARDKVRREKEAGRAMRLGAARSEVKAFIQNVHHFRDDGLADQTRPPIEHVALFDEAQRAWTHEQTAGFMKRKKGVPDFAHSEPAFLISCMDRHRDWAVVVCLVGGGQEINTGEAGIGEWVRAVLNSFPDWRVHISPRLHDSEYGAGEVLRLLGGGTGLQTGHPHVTLNEDLHLGVSMRSFRAEHVSAFVKAVLDLDMPAARAALAQIHDRYPIVLTRDLRAAKAWVRERARGSERYGMVVSSQAQRLKPHAIDVRPKIDPVHWFLHGREDVRSSYYLEDAATEFDVQGLELDWACVVWDGDFRCAGGAANAGEGGGWGHYSFKKGRKWERVVKAERRVYQKNAYRVLLTRARQGMAIVVPEGDAADPTRASEFYDPTYEYLRQVGLLLL